MSVARLTAEAAGAALRSAGVDPGDLTLEARDERWLARLGDGRMAWFPMGAAGPRLLEDERRILRLIEARCDFRAPRVVLVSPEGWDLRDPVAGLFDPTALYHRLQSDTALAQRLGASLGAALAQQHSRISPDDLPGMSTVVGWPMPDVWLWERLPRVVDDGALLDRVRVALARYRALPVDAPVLVHGDLGLHNIALDPASDDLAGIFDYGGAALADRHEDFRYLLFDGESEAMLEGAQAVYEPAVGLTLDRARIRLVNAACAIGFLAFRDGHGPDESWAGRTLAEDLAWTDSAMRRAGI